MKGVALFLLSVFVMACTGARRSQGPAKNFQFIGSYEIPFNFSFQNTVVGGLSGIDYNGIDDEYYLISDDRSDINPARYYTARIGFSSTGLDSFYLTSVAFLKNPNGHFFASFLKDSIGSCDPEGIRYDPSTLSFIWSSEGERVVRPGSQLLIDPGLYRMRKDGSFIDSFRLPSNLQVRATERGPRRNGVFEGLCLAEDGRTVYASVEEPLYEDGPRAGNGDSTGIIRIIKFNVESRRPTAQFAYPIDAVRAVPDPPGAFRINGVVDVLEAGKGKLFVLERSFSTGIKKNGIRLYLVSLDHLPVMAEDGSLFGGKKRPALRKTLVLNMDTLPIHIDNIEGMCWGPKLQNGRSSMVFVSDNNFNKSQVSQLLFFEVNY